MEDTEKVKEIIKAWIELDDESRKLQTRQKEIRDEKSKISDNILGFMRDNQVDNFTFEGNEGTLKRTVRTSKPPLRRELVKTQLLLHFADQPQRVADALKSLEGNEENITQRELLSRRVPRKTVHLS
jgi:seryl-tRNA synthetase